MKKLFTNTFLTTGACLLLMALVAIANPYYDVDFAITILHTFVGHLVINAGLRITERFEFSYRVLNYVIDVAWSTVIVIIVKALGWFEFVSFWMLFAISLIVHFVIFILEMHRARSEIATINKLIREKRF